MKKWKNARRVFLNPAKDCTAAVTWHVQFVPASKNKKGDPVKAYMDAWLEFSKDSYHVWATRKGDLRQINNMIRELKNFKECCEDALADVEKSNAAS